MGGVTGSASAGLSLAVGGGSVSLPGGASALHCGLLGHVGLGSSSSGGHFHGDADHKLYLESTVLERKIPEADLRQLIDLPPGLDLNEWLASHSTPTRSITIYAIQQGIGK